MQQHRSTWIVPALALIAVAAVQMPASYATTSTRPGADTTIVTVVTTSDALAFDPDVITVKAGTPVKIRYVNSSALAHNLVIVKTDADIDVIGPASFNAHDTGFVPMEHKSRMIAFSPLATAGKTVELSFVAPNPGEYPFVCFVDGHFNMMIGKLRSLP